MANNFFDTISAIATPLQTGAVGIIRISGEKAFEIVKHIFSGKEIEVGKICYGWIIWYNFTPAILHKILGYQDPRKIIVLF